MGILFLPAARQGRCSGLLFCSAVRPLLLLRLRLRLIPTSDTDTLVVTEASVATLDTDTLVATPALDTLVDTEDMVLDTLVDTEDMVLATLVVTTASARLRLSPRLMLMLRLIPTSDTDTA